MPKPILQQVPVLRTSFTIPIELLHQVDAALVALNAKPNASKVGRDEFVEAGIRLVLGTLADDVQKAVAKAKKK